jgi:transcriptional/translational regulatory protein YebC/TACO1
MFDHVGLIEYEAKDGSADDMFEAALEAGADDVKSNAEWHVITCATDEFSAVRDALINKFGDPSTAKLDWIAQNTVELDLETAQKILKLVDALEDNDDVQSVAGNYVISDEIAEKL